MKISFNWVKEYIEIKENLNVISKFLTQSGLEVVSIKKVNLVKKNILHLIFGKVISFVFNFNKLKKITVNTGRKNVFIFCDNLLNININDTIIIAPIGIILNTHNKKKIKIKKIKIHNFLSKGLICSKYEIGINSIKNKILFKNKKFIPGSFIWKYFNTKEDFVIEFDITPNRSDSLFHIGIARELSIILSRPIYYPFINQFKRYKKIIFDIKVKIIDLDYCPRYSGILIKNIIVQKSPNWLINKLYSINVNAVNNIIDIINFVLHETGQPLHVFDYDKIYKKKIIVKKVKKNTKFLLLNNKKIILNGDELMVCNEKEPMAIAGIINGENFIINSNTKNIFLESSFFNSKNISKVKKYHALNTSSSFIHERGSDPNMTIYALKRASLLIKKIVNNSIESDIFDFYPKKIIFFNIKIYYKNIYNIIGKNISYLTIVFILKKLEILVLEKNLNNFIVNIPIYRVDINREIDIIEEIIRIYGYDKIKNLNNLNIKYLSEYNTFSFENIVYKISNLLSSNGYYEIYTNSLTKSKYLNFLNKKNKEKAIFILNPLNTLVNTLRQNLVFSGLEAIAYNINRKQFNLNFFEFGKIYYKEKSNYIEKNKLGIWITGDTVSETWIKKNKNITFQDLNFIIYKIINKFKIYNFEFINLKDILYEKIISLYILNKKFITIGKVSSVILNNFHIKQNVFFAEIDFELFLNKIKNKISYNKISKSSLTKRDLSLIINKSVTFNDINKIIKLKNNKYIKYINIFDIYQGDGLKDKQKSYSLSLMLNIKNSNDINKIINNLIFLFEKKLLAFIKK